VTLKLMAEVRPEFRAEILAPDRGTLVFDAAPRQVAECVRQPRTRGLCKGHHNARAAEGRPDLDGFTASASPEGVGRKELTVCVVEGCGRSTSAAPAPPVSPTWPRPPG